MPAQRSISSQFFSGMFVIGIARAATIVLGLASMMIAVRYTSAEEYGAYVLIIVITAFLAEFMSFGMTLAIPKYLASAQDKSYTQALNNTVFNFRLLSILAVILLIFISHPFLNFLFGKLPLLDMFIYLPMLFGLSSMSLLFSSILRGQLNFAALGIIELVTDIVELTALSLGIFIFNLGVYSLFLAKFISGGAYIILGYLQIHFQHKFKIDMPILKELLKFGFPLQMQFFLDFSFSRIDTVIIGTLLGTGGIAYYEIARKIPDSLMQLYSVFVSVYFPISANLYASEVKEKTERLINNSVRILAFLTIFSALASVIFGKDIIKLLFSDAYLPSYFAFVLLMIGFTLKVFENTLGYSLVAIGDSDKPLIVNVVRAIISLAGNIIFLPIAGFIGAALVSVVSNLLVIPLDMFFLWRRQLYMEFVEYLKPIAILAVFSLPFIGLETRTLSLKFFVFILYLPACFLLSVVTPHDLTLFYRETQQALSRFFKRQEFPASEN